MWKLLRFTRDTVGENSPLKVQRVYQISGLRYFLCFEGIMAGYMGLMGVVFIVQLSTTHFTTDVSYPVLAYLLIVLMPVMCFGGSALMIALLINHWPYTGGVIIRTYPAEHMLELTLPTRKFLVGEGDIARIEGIHRKARIGYSYWIYYLTNGDRFILSERVAGQWVIREYFPKIPISGSNSQFGFIP